MHTCSGGCIPYPDRKALRMDGSGSGNLVGYKSFFFLGEAIPTNNFNKNPWHGGGIRDFDCNS